MRRLRSLLYMPGANVRALEKAEHIPADGVILDLEDAVAPSAKVEARERVCSTATVHRYPGRTVAIRVNAIGSIWHEKDLLSAAEAGPDAILVPKVNTVDDVHAVERVLDDHAPTHTHVWAMLETPIAVLHAEKIAGCSDRLSVLVMGTNDLAKEMYVEAGLDRAPLLSSLSACVLGARAHGKMIVDGVYNDVRDPGGFEAECKQARRFGFDGKTLIHPGQVGPCNAAFTPSTEDVAHAMRVIQAFEEAEQTGTGVATVDGRLIESLHVELARRTLAFAISAS